MIYFLALALTIGTPTPALGGHTLPERLLYGAPKSLTTIQRHYLQKRWRKMCRGPERYDAMREAYDLGMKPPC